MTCFKIKHPWGRLLFSLLLVLTTSAAADTHADLFKAAEAKFRARQYEAAQSDALRARELAQTPQGQLDANLLLASILARQNKADAALGVYQEILAHQEASATHQAKARLGIAGVYISKKDYTQAREAVAPVLTMDIPVSYKHDAQGDLLRTWWGYGDWRTLGDLDALHQTVQEILAEEQEAWPGRHARVLQDAGDLVRSSRAYAQAREYYEQILSLDGVPVQTVVGALRNIARTYVSGGDAAHAREVLKQVMQLEGIRTADRAHVLRDLAATHSSAGEYAAAREILDQALALEEVPVATRAAVLGDLCDTYLQERALHSAASVLGQLFELEAAPASGVSRQVSQLTAMAVKRGDHELADELYRQLIALDLNAAELHEAYTKLADIRMARQDYDGVRQALTFLAEADGSTDAQQLTTQLQIAGTIGAAGEMDRMKQRIGQAVADYDGLPATDKIRAFWDAAKLLVAAREYEPARVLLKHADDFTQQGGKSYTVRPVGRGPVDVGGWLASGLLDEPGMTEARFYPYSQQDAAALLAVDVRADRAIGDASSQAEGPGETYFAMVYDTRGWHIYVHAGEPLIDQIVAKDGQGGSSLEMFFTPGVDNEPYYQWIIQLATGELSVYDWSTPNRRYRSLQGHDSYFRVDTAELENGWGTAIFISWEMFYDQLPLLGDGDRVWRFSMQRWDPSGSVTWGGRVHETGRWGRILFEQPSESQRAAIKRHLVQRAWWHYQTVVDEQAAFWSGSRGDLGFYEQLIEPMVQAAQARGDIMRAVDEWNAATLNTTFEEQVPRWQEVRYVIDAQRQAYLREKLLSGE